MSEERVRQQSSLIFILGGARSGKSDYALEVARRLAGDQPVLFIATAQAGDAEMDERIARHREERPQHWQTLEASLGVGNAWRQEMARRATSAPRPGVAILDCVTLLVSNLLFAGDVDPETEEEATFTARLIAELDELIHAQRELACPLIVVSNEVGLGIVPLGRISRLYRDLIGRANRHLAAAADHAHFLLAGIPLDLKRLAAEEIERLRD
jgi:adenosylcobinamide kinase / adenosylcobinamide-phosphate guanylyltransferase